MKVPPKGDPMRPLVVAMRSTRGLGMIYLVLGAGLFALVAWSTRRAGAPSQVVGGLVVYGVIFILPGVLYIVFSIFMQRRQFWAIVAALVLASIQTMFLLLGAVSMIVQLFVGVGFHPGMLIAGSVIGCFLAAFIVLIVQLARSFPSLKADRIDFDRGFVPVLTAQAEARAPATTPERPE